jgi:UMF1 family MFS transporter
VRGAWIEARLRALGLHRPELRAWAAYDWANSAFAVMAAATFPVFYARVAAAGLPPHVATSRFAFTASAALAVVAVALPVLGAAADVLAVRKRLLAAFVAVGAAATAGLWFVDAGGWAAASLLFALANVGWSGSLVFYDSLLPHVAREDEVDRVSAAGYALGYLGGGLLLALNLAWVLAPAAFGLPDAAAALRLGFVSVGAWWILFSLPLLRRVREPRGARGAPGGRGPGGPAGPSPLRAGFARLGETSRELRRHRQALRFLLAALLYGEGIDTLIRLAAAYGAELGIGSTHLLGAILLVQVVGVPCTVLFGALAGRIGAVRAIYLALAVYVGIAVLGYYMTSAAHFYALALLVGTVLGGSQALTRSVYASLVPKHQSSEFFALSAAAGMVAGIVGPAVFGAVSLAAGTSRTSVLAVAVFFVGGLALLRLVDFGEGRASARAADGIAGPALADA